MTDTLFRSIATTLERTDRRTLEGLFMPWDVATPVIDIDPITGAPDRYREGFRAGAFDRQVSSAEPGVVRRIVLRDQHHDGLGKLGHVVSLRNEDAGLHGVVSLLPSRVLDVDALLEDEVTGLSCEFHPLGRSVRDEDGTIWRTRAHLVAVALEAQPAYADARVLAMRASDEIAALDAEEAAAARREIDDLDEYLTSARDSVRRYVPTLSPIAD